MTGVTLSEPQIHQITRISLILAAINGDRRVFRKKISGICAIRVICGSDLPGCVTEGDTLDEAIENAREAIELHIETLQSRGEPVPEETEPPKTVSVRVAA